MNRYARFATPGRADWPGIGAILEAAEQERHLGQCWIWGVLPDGKREEVGVLRITAKGYELDGLEPAVEEGGIDGEGRAEQAAAGGAQELSDHDRESGVLRGPES